MFQNAVEAALADPAFQTVTANANFGYQYDGSADFTAMIENTMALFGVIIIVSLSTKDVLKGRMMGCMGLVIACIGRDPMLGKMWFTFGNTFLMGGITMIPAVIGLFSISQIFSTIKDPVQPADKGMIAQFKSANIRLKDLVRYPVTYLRSAIIGIVMGIIPGTGGDAASYVSHNADKMFSKEPDFGPLRKSVCRRTCCSTTIPSAPRCCPC